MNLIISLSNPDILPESLRTRRVEFGASGGTIGRNQECDWVLDDPERFVSSKHLRILLKGNSFFAEDISTNGTYHNEDLIGKGNKVPLVTGDVLRLGRFILAVEQRDDSGSVIDKTGAAASGGDLLAETSNGRGNDLMQSVKSDDLLAAHGETEEIDDFIGDSFVMSDDTEGDDGLLSDFSPLPGVQDALPVMRQTETSDAVPSDWMTRKPEADKAEPLSGDVLSGGGKPTGTLDDYGLTPVPPKDVSIPEDEPVPKVKAKVKPKPKPEGKKVTAPKAVKKKTAQKKTPAKKAEPKATVKASKAKPATKKPVKKIAASTAAAVTTAAAVSSIAAKEEVKNNTVEPVATPESVLAAVPAPAPIEVVAPLYSEPASEEFGTSFASALLLKPALATGETGHILGLVMRELIEGSLDLMDSRNQMRQELRLSAPSVGARENNPLKLSINYQDALSRMLQGESMGFKPPVESANEVIDDLKRHQLGVLAGIDAGVKALLDALDPKKIGGGKTVIAGLSMTSKMSEHHARIKEDTVERSDGVFWRAFSEAYKIAISTSYER